jgi:hypothetical protein
MMERLRRYSVTARIIGILILLGVLAVVIYQLYDFYSERVGFTPSKAITAYFTALAQGNYEEVYLLTDKEELTDIYGRPLTKGEFIEQLRMLRGSEPLPFTGIESEKLFDTRGLQYYRVTLSSQFGGASGSGHVVVQLRRLGNTWVIKYPFAILL